MPEICKDLKISLLRNIRVSSKVFIIGHNDPDFDSISSAIAVATLCRFLGKESYIIVDDMDENIEPGVKKIIDSNKDKYNMIKLSHFKELSKDDSNMSLVVVDANKDYQLSVSPYLSLFKTITVIDHHNPDEHTIPSTTRYISTKTSSAAEMLARVLNSCHCKYDSNVANYLLAGIELDTNRYKKNTTSTTHDIAEKLIINGASPDFVNELFLAEFETDRRINNLLYNHTLFEQYERSLIEHRQVSFTLNKDPKAIYRKEDLAKAADKMLEYPVDASFVIGRISNDIISISARSKSDINVGSIMEKMQGGGNSKSAACKVPSKDIESVEEKLKGIVATSISESTPSPIKDQIIELEIPKRKIKLLEVK